ncbi:hypothetical protein P7C70_g975, partial [Phenoliferia sp. Uapishka_3]
MSLAIPAVLLSTVPLSAAALTESELSDGSYSEGNTRQSSPDAEDSDANGSPDGPDAAVLRRRKASNLPTSSSSGERCPQFNALADVSLEQLAAANTSSKAWVAVRGKVYNLTKFASRHPGGKAIILMGAGKDVTPLFETSHGPMEERTLSKFLVGTLVGKAVPSFPVADEFSKTLKAAFFFASRLALPFYIAPGVSPIRVLGAFAVSDAVFSFTFGLISQASHVVEDVEFPTIDPVTGNVEKDWMRLQVETAQDYAHDSAVTTFLVGALNFQAVHHLFPQVAQPYIPQIAPIVIQTCKEFGVKYNIKPTLWQAIGGHIGLLKLMGEPPHEH